ncbi:hypothetical protein AJ79_09470 [Helicocarpus griseus UAMH5409]|uniref:PH domain-containing protein n=1 Tax=Helicocarpus griseus UAMH5409 TaxID=1447875 RepID=A0A2B7WJD8_9EURO|nr:hypothetical protein AJ79_09470 [Helicocarpus griseus UAMH5409]
MAAQIIAFITQKILKEGAENKFGQEDPYFEKVEATDLFGRTITKKKKKAAPEGISAHDAKVLTKVKRRAHRLDVALCNFCGIRFGWSSVIALIPAFGDVVDVLLALMVVSTCSKIDGGLPSAIQMRMLFNIVFDFFVGLIPFVGDLADAMYKCNSRNAVLLEKVLRERGRENMKNTALPLHETRPQTGTGPDRESNTRGSSRQPTPPRNDWPARPQPARVHTGKSSKDAGPSQPARAHTGKSSKDPKPSPSGRRRVPDIEMGRM